MKTPETCKIFNGSVKSNVTVQYVTSSVSEDGIKIPINVSKEVATDVSLVKILDFANSHSGIYLPAIVWDKTTKLPVYITDLANPKHKLKVAKIEYYDDGFIKQVDIIDAQ